MSEIMAGGESVNIADIAAEAAERILFPFGWKIDGIEDENFPCSYPEEHKRKTKNSDNHPVDSVFHYDHPYLGKRQYLVTDYKSYSVESIKKKQFNSVIRDLACSVECAETSPEWQKRYVHDDCGEFNVHGLLFVYNHDNEFDGAFSNRILSAAGAKLRLPRRSRVYVIGPDTINYLESVATDLKVQCTDKEIGSFSRMRFQHPDKIEQWSSSNYSNCSPVEVLLSPFQIVAYPETDSGSSNQQSTLVYYRGDGKTQEEFEFFIDFFFKKQMVQENKEIEIRGPYLCDEAPLNFKNAKDALFLKFHKIPEIMTRLDQFKLKYAKRVLQGYSKTEIGLNRRK